jgi:hypothetical protein
MDHDERHINPPRYEIVGQAELVPMSSYAQDDAPWRCSKACSG